MTVVQGRRRAERTEQPPATPAVTPPVEPPATSAATVNLLSPWARERVRVAALRKRFGYAVLAALVVVGAAWTGQQLRLGEARAELRGEEAVGRGLQTRIEALAPVAAYVAEVEGRAATVGGVMWTEIEMSRVLGTLRATVPDAVVLSDVALTLPVAGDPVAGDPAAGSTAGAAPGTTTPAEPGPEARGIAATCPGPDPFGTRTVVGCVTLAGSAPSRATVADLVRRLSDAGLFVEPFVSTTTTGPDEPVSFSGSVGISPQAFSGRYDDLAAAPTPEEAP